MGIIGQLLCLYCNNGCSSGAIVSALAFYPPDPPLYKLRYDEAEKKLEFSLNYKTMEVPNYLKADIVVTKRSQNIPVFILRNPKAKFTILWSHANATDLGGTYERAVFLYQRLYPDVQVCCYEYSGYGYSTGRPTDTETYSDIESIYDWLCRYSYVKDPSKEIILYGQSIGSGPTSYLGSSKKRPVAGIIMHSGIMSGMRVITKSRLLCCLDIFPNINRAKKFKVPTFIIHGVADTEVRIDHGEGLYANINNKYKVEPWFVEGKGHNDVLIGARDEKEYIRRLQNFFSIIESGSCNEKKSFTKSSGTNPADKKTDLCIQEEYEEVLEDDDDDENDNDKADGKSIDSNSSYDKLVV